MRIIASGLAAFVLVAPALPISAGAQPTRLPAAIAKEIPEMQRQCREVTGKPGDPSQMVTRADLNGDGAPDYVVSWALYDCPGAASLFAGTAATGDPITVYLAGPGGTARDIWSGGVGDMKVVKIAGRDALQFMEPCDNRPGTIIAAMKWCDEKLVPGPGGKWRAVRLAK